MDMPTHTEIELLFIHKFAVLETKSPVFEEDTKTTIFPQRENTIFVISEVLHSTGLNIRKLPKSKPYTKICKELKSYFNSNLENIQRSLCRLESVFEKPPSGRVVICKKPPHQWYGSGFFIFLLNNLSIDNMHYK